MMEEEAVFERQKECAEAEAAAVSHRPTDGAAAAAAPGDGGGGDKEGWRYTQWCPND